MSTPATSHPRTAVITGGAGDLAQAIAAELQCAGFTVLAPGRAAMDVTCADSVRAFFATLTGLDLLINNAGVCCDASTLKMSEADFDHVVNVNLKGAFFTTQAAVKLMSRQRHGHIINIGSYSALSGPAGQANYAAAKAGLIGLTQSTAKEYGPRNIRANCILPGFLDTKMTRHLIEDAARKDDLLGSHVLGRLNSPQDAARFIAFLQSMENVSGQVFQLDSRIRRWS
ncbi:SDR family oxidoreductase [Prosthecobacter vanneervenii]|uniref:3-oxoacyl-[acyl-carrier protein] reductase n=1 Tax=Prosthecobacter vanneervenii TaxID=48466 RepID=A0A7W8DJ15_9BACT|nr:SDR family oxidoreductase [Prosthecobacter vanneervenii]MBB5031653.1 3-oxoacyl-[acyl-carrier protein] reductase [Prosthecobacter vanneervenii]